MRLPQEKNIWTKIYNHADEIRSLKKSDFNQWVVNIVLFAMCGFSLATTFNHEIRNFKNNTQGVLQQVRNWDNLSLPWSNDRNKSQQ